jgi:5-formyltetrahydrofolate cyclo-ligase
MNKQALRELYKNKRQDVPPKTRLQYDDLMLIQFQKFDFSGVRSLLTYWPMPHQAEPNTHLFSGYLRHMVPGLSIAYPVMDPDAHSFTAHQIDENTVYKPGKFGVLEPDAPNPIDPETMGFSYFDPIQQIADTDQFDVPLHYLITPSRIYEF